MSNIALVVLGLFGLAIVIYLVLALPAYSQTRGARTTWPGNRRRFQGASQTPSAHGPVLTFETLKQWYAGKDCAVCHRQMPLLQHTGQKPGLVDARSPSREILTWEEVPDELIATVLQTHLPVCASCLLAESFRREFPELVIDRREHPQPGTTMH
jgi:hypothetical protein